MVVLAEMILAERGWEIHCPIGRYRSENAAYRALNSASAELVRKGGRAYLRVSVGGKEILLADSDIAIFGLSQFVQALLLMDPAYVVEDTDMIPSHKTLNDFVERYGDGYKLQCIGKSWKFESTSDLKRNHAHTAGTGYV